MYMHMCASGGQEKVVKSPRVIMSELPDMVLGTMFIPSRRASMFSTSELSLPAQIFLNL